MSSKRVSRNEPCPCGSGKKYKKCCYLKTFQFEETADGEIQRSIPMNEDLSASLSEYIASLDDPNGMLFPDSNLEHAEFEMVRSMERANINPAIIYAFQETGMLISEENMELFSRKDLDLWQSKIEEYEQLHGIAETPNKFPLGVVALYGPDDSRTTKIVASVMLHEDAEPILQRFVGSDVVSDETVQKSIEAFLREFKVKEVLTTSGNIGCPHEEGEDFPMGGDCPFCPFWKGKQGSSVEPF